MGDSPKQYYLTDEQILSEPLASFDLDSLSWLDFVMKIESELDVELNESDVNKCRTLKDFVILVDSVRHGGSQV